MKERLDVLLVNMGLAPSREQARALIMEGKVYVNGGKEDKPGMRFDLYSSVEVRGEKLPFVSRGGLKLQKAAEVWALDLTGMTCMDVGASTGGFTDCMLQHGAAKVYAVDVGYGQLHWKLRNDPRVINLEKTNIRYLTPEQVPDPLDFASVDVSFISLTKVLPVLITFMKPLAKAVVLIKPQFEAGREKVGKKGVVREPETHVEVCRALTAFAADSGFAILGLDYSPVRGPEGNIEYLMYLQKDGPESSLPDIEKLVAESHLL